MAYISTGPTYGSFSKQTLTGVNGSTTNWSLTYAVSSSSSIMVVSGGVIQEPDVAYNVITSGTVLSFTTAPTQPTYVIFLGKQYLVPTMSGYETVLNQFTGDGTTTVFNLTSTPVVNSGAIVIVDGIMQTYGASKNWYLSGTQIVFTSAPAASTDIDVYILCKERISIDTVADGSIALVKLATGLQPSLGVWNVVSTNTTMTNGNWYMVDTFAAARTLTLPASPSMGDTFKVMDYSGTFATNNCTISRNTKLINGLAEDLIMDINNGNCELRYTGATYGWRVIV